MITEQDVEILARTIYGEARGEDRVGKDLVAEVMMNRYLTGYRGKDSITAVCQDPWQFSCWNKADPNKWKILNIDLSDSVFRQCMLAALIAIDMDPDEHNMPQTTRHYFADYIDPPNWAEDDKLVETHGVHKFFAGIA